MKTKVLIMAILTFTMSGCVKFDDSHLWDSINSLNDRVERLEDICDRMNTNISSLQAIVQALENNDAVTSVSSLPDASGYTITFASGKVITIYNGTDGKDGEDGKDGLNGTDGQDGRTPIISIRQDVDGVYYWTVDGEWLIVDGQKVKAVGTDGKDGIDGQDGEDGKDGITPQFKIENGYWHISYDNGMSWIQLGKATGDNGLNGADGESLFKGVSIENGYVYFILNDTESTVIKIQYSSDMSLTITVEEGTLDKVLTREQQLSLTTLTLEGTINEDDMKFLNSHMTALENLNMENVNYTPLTFKINPYGELLPNRTLRTIVTPKEALYDFDFDYCVCLEKLVITSDTVMFVQFFNDSPKLSSIDSLIVAEGVTTIGEKSAYYFNTVILPSSLISVNRNAFAYGDRPQIKTIISKASQPPHIVAESGGSTTSFYDGYNKISRMNLYVPASSVELYKKAPGWSQFKNILPIEE